MSQDRPTCEPGSTNDGRSLTRRSLLRRTAVIGLSASALGALLASCGGDDVEPTATTAAQSGGTGATSTTTTAATTATTAATRSSAASPTSSAPTRKTGGSLRVGTTIDALNLDPHNYRTTSDLQIANIVYDTMIGVDPQTLELTPRLATKWEATNQTTWRFELRENVTFIDGAPFNADAVKFNVERAQNAERSKSYIAPVKSVNLVDDYTIELLTDGPNFSLLRNLSVNILSLVSPKAAQEAPDALQTKPVGTGPFMVKEWVQRQQMTVVRNPDYWGEKAALDEIVFLPITDDSTRLGAFKAGDIDVMLNPPLETVASLRTESNTQVVLQPATRTVWFGFNVGDETLKNEKLRQALTSAVNREALVVAVAEDLVRQAVGLVPPEILKPDFTLPWKYDQQAAKRLLAEAGHPNGLKLNFWTPEGRYPKDRAIAEAIQQQLNEIGVETDLSVMEWGAYNAAVGRHEQQLYIIGWGFASGDPDGGLRQIAASESTFNYTNFKNPEIDAALNAAVQEQDLQKRGALYNDIQERLLQTAAYAPVYHNVTIVVTKGNVKGFLVNPLEMFDLKDTYLD